MVTFKCKQCGQKYRLGDEYAGKRVRCKKCSAVIAAPEAEASRRNPAEEAGGEGEASPLDEMLAKLTKPEPSAVVPRPASDRPAGASARPQARPTKETGKAASGSRPMMLWGVGGGVALIAVVIALVVSWRLMWGGSDRGAEGGEATATMEGQSGERPAVPLASAGGSAAALPTAPFEVVHARFKSYLPPEVVYEWKAKEPNAKVLFEQAFALNDPPFDTRSVRDPVSGKPLQEELESDAPTPAATSGRLKPYSDMLAKQAKALDLYDQGIAVGQLQIITKFEGWESKMMPLGGFIPMTHYKVGRAKLRAGSGDWDGGVKDLISAERAAQMVQRGEGSSVMGLTVSLALHRPIFAGMRSLAGMADATPEQIRALADELGREETLHRDLQAAWRMDMAGTIWTLAAETEKHGSPVSLMAKVIAASTAGAENSPSADQLVQKWTQEARRQKVALFDEATTLKELGAYYGDMIKAMEPMSHAQDKALAASVERRAKGWAEQAKDTTKIQNVVGIWVLGACSNAGLSTVRQVDLVLAARATTRLALLVRAYELERHSLPPNLDALVSAGLLKELPIDPFSGKAFMYDPARRVIWSVGPEGTFNGVLTPYKGFDKDLLAHIPPCP